MRTKQILLFGLVTCSLTGNMACKDADSEKTLCIDNVRMISRVTGDPLPGDTLLNPNNTGPDFDVYGTDLGLMWHMDGNRVGMFFGDTSGEGFVVNKNGGNGSNWRSNVLAFSSDTELTDGLKIVIEFLHSISKCRTALPTSPGQSKKASLQMTCSSEQNSWKMRKRNWKPDCTS